VIGEFSLLQWALMLAIGLISGFVHGFVGIGFPLIATPLFALMFSFQRAVPMLVLPTLVLVVCTFVAFGHAISARAAFQRYWPLLLMSPLGIVAGTRALFTVEPNLLMVMLAAVMSLYLYLDWRGRTRVMLMDRHPTAFAFPFGLAAGFCEGAVNVSGPMLLIYFLLLDLEATAIIAVMNYLFLLGKVVQSGVLTMRGAFDQAVLQTVVPLSLAGAATFFVGVRLRSRFDPRRYRGWLKATLAFMVLMLLLRVVRGA
jgi:uncharacterized membrane protein YfcA